MTFIIFHKDGTRETYSNRYDEDDEYEFSMQKSSVVNELKKHFGVSDLDLLAVRLSIG